MFDHSFQIFSDLYGEGTYNGEGVYSSTAPKRISSGSNSSPTPTTAATPATTTYAPSNQTSNTSVGQQSAVATNPPKSTVGVDVAVIIIGLIVSIVSLTMLILILLKRHKRKQQPPNPPTIRPDSLPTNYSNF